VLDPGNSAAMLAPYLANRVLRSLYLNRPDRRAVEQTRKGVPGLSVESMFRLKCWLTMAASPVICSDPIPPPLSDLLHAPPISTDIFRDPSHSERSART
jgi:hypothetical protein